MFLGEPRSVPSSLGPGQSGELSVTAGGVPWSWGPAVWSGMEHDVSQRGQVNTILESSCGQRTDTDTTWKFLGVSGIPGLSLDLLAAQAH